MRCQPDRKGAAAARCHKGLGAPSLHQPHSPSRPRNPETRRTPPFRTEPQSSLEVSTGNPIRICPAHLWSCLSRPRDCVGRGVVGGTLDGELGYPNSLVRMVSARDHNHAPEGSLSLSPQLCSWNFRHAQIFCVFYSREQGHRKWMQNQLPASIGCPVTSPSGELLWV